MTIASSDPKREVLFDVQNLEVGFQTGDGYKSVVSHFNLRLHKGETVAIVGESGSGKTVATRALLGLAGDNAVVKADVLRYRGQSLLSAKPRKLKALRGAQVGYVLQDALVSLDPLQPVRREIAEALHAHLDLDRRQTRQRIMELLTKVGVPQPEIRQDQYPGELSGGLRQRALIATALAQNPPVIIADEPTTALDVLVQGQVLQVLRGLIKGGTSLILISHDLSVVASVADVILVMKAGKVVESGSTEQVLGNPRHPYTQALIRAVPGPDTRGRRLSDAPSILDNLNATPSSSAATGEVLLQACDLRKSFKAPDGQLIHAIRNASLDLKKGEVLGIVGQSGSGKSTVARVLLGLTPLDGGSVRYQGIEWLKGSHHERRKVRGKIAMVYQDPYSSFDPRWTVARILSDVLSLYGGGKKAQQEDVIRLLTTVGLNAQHAGAYPINLSGGQRQRVAIARALAVNPEVLVLDEAVSALDVSIQAQILDLLVDLRAKYDLSIIFISHDLGVIHHIADRVLVMKDGVIVEEGRAEEIFASPRHPYTQELIAALPKLERASSFKRAA
ncbi:ABC transporter ATP-binding protein [Herbaspirillum sp. RV1423]|uniref:dipeptide ABC transporter ATP-binding protein n=1 Tax=Herbaspirillum sp. RV1423 TaxID=1443993 RepID=UPI0004B46778|nr:ABC transporter ATP-binding protein [Herbaspirillum sp. RV1423]